MLRVVNLVLFIVLLAHWNACLQFLVPMLKEFPTDSWVVLEELQHAPKLEQYTWSLFKAMSHMLCIGYGRFPPQGAADVWITMASMLTGAVCYAMFVGQATAYAYCYTYSYIPILTSKHSSFSNSFFSTNTFAPLLL